MASQQNIARTADQSTVAGMLTKYKDQIAAALPKHMTPERMTRIALTEIRKSSYLSKANPISLMGAIVQAAQLGLEPGNALGHCYLVPFKGDVQLIIGYRGMIDLARRSGQIVSLSAHVVYQADTFSYSYGLNESLNHVPAPGDDRGEPTHAYAAAKLVGGGAQFHVMTWKEILEVRDLSEGYQAFKSKRIRSNPWDSHLDEMACKTVVRRLFKYLPVSVEIQRAVLLDEHADSGIAQNNAAIIDSEFMVLDEDDEEQGSGVTLKDQIRSTKDADKAPEPPQDTTSPDAATEGSREAKATRTLESVQQLIADAKDLDDLDYARSLIKEHLSPADQKTAETAAKARAKELSPRDE